MLWRGILVAERSYFGTHGGERQGKKSQWGTLKGAWVPPDVRDEIVDYVAKWKKRADWPSERSFSLKLPGNQKIVFTTGK